MNGCCRAGIVRGPNRTGPRKTLEELELATLGWVHCHNKDGLHGFIGDVPTAEFEEAFYAENCQVKALTENATLGFLQNPGRASAPKSCGLPPLRSPAKKGRDSISGGIFKLFSGDYISSLDETSRRYYFRRDAGNPNYGNVAISVTRFLLVVFSKISTLGQNQIPRGQLFGFRNNKIIRFVESPRLVAVILRFPRKSCG